MEVLPLSLDVRALPLDVRALPLDVLTLPWVCRRTGGGGNRRWLSAHAGFWRGVPASRAAG